MEEMKYPVSRRRFVGIASAIGALPLVGRSSLTAAAPARQEESGEAFPNGINVTRYMGADGSYEKYKSEGIRLGLIEAFPVNFTDPETGERTGWNTDLVLRALEHSRDRQVRVRRWTMGVDGPRPAERPLRSPCQRCSRHPERIEIIDFTAPTFWYGDALFVPTGNPANVHSWEDLAGKTVGVGLGTNYAEWLQKRTDLGTLNTYKGPQEMAADLVAGRIDALIAEDSNFTGYLAENPDLPIENVPEYVPQSDLSDWTRFGTRIGDNEFNNVFSRALIEMLITGETLAILQKYGLGIRNLAAFPGM